MAELARPHPPGEYPVVVVGSGPGGLQTSYYLGRYGVRHALISGDDAPGGMFRRLPILQRLISWTKVHAPAERGSERYEWYDWNSLLGEKAEHRALAPRFMDGRSYFPTRKEMEAQLVEFARRAALACRFGCRWESTGRIDDGRFVVETTDGPYVADTAIFATGMAEPWKPPGIPGIEHVPHYVDVRAPESYAGRSVFLIGKRNSAFELADGLLPFARQIVLASPRPVRMSVLVHSSAAARARYIQPYEDHVLGGGNLVLDATIERIERIPGGLRVHTEGTRKPGQHVFEVDEVIAATGFAAALGDLKRLGVATFYQNRLPAQTPYWESTSVPGIYFAGTMSQGSVGLRKYGHPSGSAAVHGFRYNARVLARHLAERRFGVRFPRPPVAPGEVVTLLLGAATGAPELWNQQSYLARVIEHDGGQFVDVGAVPLADFVDRSGPGAVAITVETDDRGDIHPAVYVRKQGDVTEHLLPSAHRHIFTTEEHREELTALLRGWV